MEFHIGSTLCNGRYRIEEKLGSGSYGDVYLVRHTALQVCRAAKIIDRQHPYRVAIREADVLKGLKHPAIPVIYDIEETNAYVVIIEEYVRGRTLQSYLFPKHTIEYRDVIRFSLELTSIVSYLHAHGIYHHDLKPENILIENGQVRLIDYGSAGFSSETETLRESMGTRGYAAPEQYATDLPGAEADIYSIGVVMLVMATGKRTQAALDGVQPAELRRIIRRCLSHAKRERYPSAQKLEQALRTLESESKNLSVPGILNLHFAGVLPHCGTTHCAITTAQVLARGHHHPLLMEHNDSNAFREIIRASNRIEFAGGIFTAEGLSYVPEYHGGAKPAIPCSYDRILHDDGVVGEDNIEQLLSGDIICLVCGASPQELTALSRLLGSGILPIDREPERFRILLNFANARRFKHAIRQYDIPNPIRVPYQVLG